MENEKVSFSHELGKDNYPLTWFHLISDDQTSNQMLEPLSIPKSAKEGLLADETRPRCLEIENGILLCLRAINFNRSSEPDDMVSLRIWLTPTVIVSATKKGRGLRSIQEVQNVIEKDQSIKSVGAWFGMLLEMVTDKISEQVEDIDNKLEVLEEELNIEPLNINRQSVLDIRKQAAQIKRFIAPQREALDVLHYSCDFISQIQHFRIKEQSDRILRYIDQLELIRERCILVLEEHRHSIAEKQSERMYVLSIVTAIFLPLSFLTGVFGMNIGGLPGIENQNAFILLSGIMVVAAALIYLIMKFKNWL